MQTYRVELSEKAGDSFFCRKAADSVDLDASKKLSHILEVSVDLSEEYSVGLIVGASGSGKTTLAEKIFGDISMPSFDLSRCVIDLFDQGISYDERVDLLNGVGLSSVPCWIKPMSTLSNGQRERAKIAIMLSLAKSGSVIVIDEWTSVVDRLAAKIMSKNISKYIRSRGVRVVFLSCHYDVVEWLNPCWIVDCNKSEYINRRSLWREYIREEKLVFDIREATRKSWGMFSKYHYLSENLPGGRLYIYGLFIGDEQIGFQCFANYVPNNKKIIHFNRTVIHPDYQGAGLGISLINNTCAIVKNKGYIVMGRFASAPVAKALGRSPEWVLKGIKYSSSKSGRGINRKTCFRDNVKTYSFLYRGKSC